VYRGKRERRDISTGLRCSFLGEVVVYVIRYNDLVAKSTRRQIPIYLIPPMFVLVPVLQMRVWRSLTEPLALLYLEVSVIGIQSI
jgi:hypothetical protein